MTKAEKKEKAQKLQRLINNKAVPEDEKKIFRQALKKLEGCTDCEGEKLKAKDVLAPTKESSLVSVDKLIVEKKNPRKSINNAKNLMQKAAKGELKKRGPISVRDNGDGTFTVLDGNATTVAAKEMGIPSLYVQTDLKKQPTKEPNQYTKDRYKGVFGDYDGDGILNVDDPNPRKKGDKETVEEVKLSDEIAKLIDFRADMDKIRKRFIEKVAKAAKNETDILSRTKTPYSIINKFRRKMLKGPNDGLTDMVGGMIIFDNQKDLEDFAQKVNNGLLGKVLEFDDYYSKPKAGYRAYHWNLLFEGAAVELQAKTERQKIVAGYSHTLYKEGKNNPELQDRFTKLALMADRGHPRAKKLFNEATKDKATATAYLTERAVAIPESKETEFVAPSRSKKTTTTKKKPATKKAPTRKPTAKETKEVAALRKEVKSYLVMTPGQVKRMAEKIQATRSKRAQSRDKPQTNKKVVPLTHEGLLRWASNPGAYDIPGADAPDNAKPTVKPRVNKKEGIKPNKSAGNFWRKLWEG